MNKPTLLQTELLKKHLRKLLTYRETYEEVYDHILAALPNQPASLNFEQAVNTIIHDDFGGPKGLQCMEESCYKWVSKEVTRQQWHYCKAYFGLASLPFTTLLFAVVYTCITYIPFTPGIFLFMFFTGALLPGLFVLIRYYKVGYYFNDRKRSIRDKTIGDIAGRPLFLMNPATFLMFYLKQKFNINEIVHHHGLITAVIVLMLTVYVLAFIRLTKDEFNVTLSGHKRA